MKAPKRKPPSRKEIEAALRFARQQLAKAEAARAASTYGTAAYEAARIDTILWMGKIAAYEFAIGLEPNE